jgi:hypothetical protein
MVQGSEAPSKPEVENIYLHGIVLNEEERQIYLPFLCHVSRLKLHCSQIPSRIATLLSTMFGMIMKK